MGIELPLSLKNMLRMLSVPSVGVAAGFSDLSPGSSYISKLWLIGKIAKENPS
jgi:hypothetical protein